MRPIIRIGNEQYAKRDKTYGLATLRKKHVEVYKDTLLFNFMGKSGKEHSLTVRNKTWESLVAKCEVIPGWELFHFFDDDGAKKTVNSTLVNEYLYGILGKHFTAKDFRTWVASVLFFDTISQFGITTDTAKKHKDKVTAFDAAAKVLGNTESVCRKY